MTEDVLRATVKAILEHAESYTGWSLQGLGMLRLRLDKRHRLHVWSHGAMVPNVTKIHDHPWNLASHVISGDIENILYGVVDPDKSELRNEAKYYIQQPIKCGPKGTTMGEPVSVALAEIDRAVFLGGQSYEQRYFDIHETWPSDGAVSIVETWTPSHVNPDLANVYFRQGQQWVSAEPRPATEYEIKTITRRALERWA